MMSGHRHKNSAIETHIAMDLRADVLKRSPALREGGILVVLTC